MTDETTNLVLDDLRHIRGAVDNLREDMREVKERLGTLEANYAPVSRCVDRIEARLERNESRLDLAEADAWPALKSLPSTSRRRRE